MLYQKTIIIYYNYRILIEKKYSFILTYPTKLPVCLQLSICPLSSVSGCIIMLQQNQNRKTFLFTFLPFINHTFNMLRFTSVQLCFNYFYSQIYRNISLLVSLFITRITHSYNRLNHLFSTFYKSEKNCLFLFFCSCSKQIN